MNASFRSLIAATMRRLDYHFLPEDYERQPFIQGLGVSVESTCAR